MRSNVVLPQPDGPTIDVNDPTAIVNDTSSTAATLPNQRDAPSRLRKLFFDRSIAIIT